MGSTTSLRANIPEDEAPELLQISERVYAITYQGWRSTMEDAFSTESTGSVSLYAVFDGHGGQGAVDYASANLLKDLARASLDEEIVAAFVNSERGFNASRYSSPPVARPDAPPPLRLTSDTSGTCATVAICRGSKLSIANVGDCTALLISHDGTFQVLSKTHRLEPECELYSDEVKRIEAAGLYVEQNRVIGELAVSRSLGDFNYKGHQVEEHLHAVTCVPSISHHQILATHKCLLLFSDGIGDGISNQTIAKLVMAGPDTKTALFAVLLEAHQASRDNTVLMCIEF
jgi:serine/threonine protein phosphatase PrpC